MQNLCQIIKIKIEIYSNSRKIDARSMPKQIQATSLKIHVKSMKSMTDPLEPLQIHDIDAKIHAQIIEIDATCMPNH